MSTWTHVAATIRFDDLRVFDDGSLPDLGKTVSYEQPQEAWSACTVPKGSEGSLWHQLWVNPEVSHLAAYTATIWGDLRDYEDVDEIVAYLSRITSGRMIRQGVAVIEAGARPPLVLRYDNELSAWVSREGGVTPAHAHIPEPNRFLSKLLLDNNYPHGRVLSATRVGALSPFGHGCSVLLCNVGDFASVEDRWDYTDTRSAHRALMAWDGIGEPKGWFRNPKRRRRISQSPDEWDQDGKRVGAVGVEYIRF